MGLAFASALIVLLASGVAVSRLGSDDRHRGGAESAAAGRAPEPTTAADSADASQTAQSSSPAPVPPSVPGPEGLHRSAATAGVPSGTDSAADPTGPDLTGRPSASGPADRAGADPGRAAGPDGSRSPAGTGSPAAGTGGQAAGAASGSGSDTADSGPSGSADSGTSGSEAGQGSGDGGSAPPTQDERSIVAATVSVGQGANGAVVGAGLGDSPETDVTVGSNQVVGDAPPSSGTAVGLGGTFFHPPPTVPTPPG